MMVLELHSLQTHCSTLLRSNLFLSKPNFRMKIFPLIGKNKTHIIHNSASRPVQKVVLFVKGNYFLSFGFKIMQRAWYKQR